MGRDMVGSFKTAAEVQRFLQDWLMKFANANTSAGPETMARYPLRNAQVVVSEIPESPAFLAAVSSCSRISSSTMSPRRSA